MTEAETGESQTVGEIQQDITTFKDCTVTVDDTFVPEENAPVEIHSIYGNWGVWLETVEELCQYIDNFKNSSGVVGEVVGDIEYRGWNSCNNRRTARL